eukprot:352639-Chlamydomonas_euryale.AAC.2
MQVVARAVDKVVPELHRRLKLQALLLGGHAALLQHRRALFKREHVGYLAAVEQVVNVLHERLQLDLCGGRKRGGLGEHCMDRKSDCYCPQETTPARPARRFQEADQSHGAGA